MPVIPVVLATLNAVESLLACLDSTLGQDYDRVEVIVIDGGSTDGTVQLVGASAAGIGYRGSTPDHGIHHAWNKAL